ncbi:signal peptidase I [Paracoccus fistulariae]|uniref:Signal peptidase I n=1 Tax=Paracoccus fistulariae TaxID=658446 RepID=A0ABY7SIH0_9RHOB|nr:signal peptidase I [Paracoccus fistulariae]MDB6182165.1 signal peptidase I [Paracoccus fistulariae]WCR06611.1 signal peptidase I [Paracoccus fistulariae]
MAEKAAKKEGLWETVKTIFWALVIAGIFRTLFFQPFWIPSGSMKDTLLIGDFLFVNKMAYGYSQYSCPFAMCPITGRILGSEPERGDVVVFRHPTQGVDFIKRLIGLPGDTVRMTDGRLWINGEEVPQVQKEDFVEIKEQQGPQGLVPRCINDPVAEGGQCVKERFTETLPNGVSYDVLNIVDGWDVDDTATFTVPEGHYFFMGDNRDNSKDSRFRAEFGGVGFVSEEYLIGRADRIMFSSAGRSLLYFWTWRGDRFFKAVN